MYVQETGKAHSRFNLAMKIEMFYEERYAQQLVELCESEHVHRNEEYAGETFHLAKIGKRAEPPVQRTVYRIPPNTLNPWFGAYTYEGSKLNA